MKLSKLSNQTNSQDPQAVNSRVFVGNLNTFQCSKTDVERMFQIYGRLAGISMHKGYAFVQFTNPFDARNACHGEDGKTVLSQTLDVNMVAEPKAHQVGRKRQNVSKTGNDWDYFYDSYYSSELLRSTGLRPKKRKRLMSNPPHLLTDAVNNNSINAAVAAVQQQQQQQQQQHLHQHQQHQQQQAHHLSHHTQSLHSQQQQQQQQHHQQQQHQHQQQVSAVAMAAMANLLPQQQLLLHQPKFLTSHNGTTTPSPLGCNGNTTTAHHSLNVFLQQQQQQQQIKQQHQQHVGQFAAAAALQLKTSPVQNAGTPMMAAAAAAAVAAAAAANQTSTLTNGEQMSTTAFGCTNSQTHQQQHQQQQQHMNNALQPLTLSMPSQHQQHQQHHHQHHQTYQQQMQQQHQQSQMQQYQQQQHHQQQHQMQQQEQLTMSQQWGPFKVYSNPDTLICGNCRECFTELAELLDHKRTYCKLRFTCKCQDVALTAKNPPTSAKLLCAVCKDAFVNPWDLMVHAQTAHMVNIYELGNEANNNNNNTNNNNNNNDNNNNANCNDAANPVTVDGGGATTSTTTVLKDTQTLPVIPKTEQNNNSNNNNNNNKSSNIQQTLESSKVNNIQKDNKKTGVQNGHNNLRSAASVGDADATAACCHNGMIADDGNGSDGEPHCMHIKFGICDSPNGLIVKEDNQRDDASLDERMSNSSHTHHSDDMKLLNGSISSRGSSPALENDEAQQQQPRACIVRTLSIEAAATNATTAGATLGIGVGMISNGLTMGLANGANATTAAIVPQ